MVPSRRDANRLTRDLGDWMKITDVRVVNSDSIDSSTALVEVATDEGITGIGATASPVPVITAVVQAGETSLKPLLIGEDPTDVNRLWLKMFESWQAQRGRGGEGGMAVNAMGAVDIALWDIAGKARGVPIYEMLGGAVQNEVMVYASTSRADRASMSAPRDEWRQKTTAEMVLECREYVEHGFKAIKYGWGQHFGPEAQDSLAAMREAVGPDIRLMLDCGPGTYLDGAWTVKEAIRVSELLEDHDIYFMEEPLHPYDVEGFKELTLNAPIKIATGESLTTVRDFQRFIDTSAIDVAQPDVQQMGMSQFIQVARATKQAGMLCIPHGPWSAILVAGHMNVLATITNGVMIEYPGFASFEEGTVTQVRTEAFNKSIIETPPVVENGYLQLPTSPGLGLGSFVHEAIAELKS